MRHTPIVFAVSLMSLATALPAAEPEIPIAASPAPEAAPAPNVQLEGPTWQLVQYRASGGLVDVVAQARPARFKFAEGALSGGTGCNRLTGSYTLDGSILTLGTGLALTRMGCPLPVMEQEKAVIQALRKVATASRDGEALELRDAQGEVLLRFSLPTTTPLAGRTWKLSTYNNGKHAMVTPIAGTGISLVLDGQGRLSGHDGCNRYMSGYTLEGDRLAIGPIATTRMACKAGKDRAEQAGAYAAALGRVASYRIEGAQLMLSDKDGKPAARFAAETTAPAQ
ncbi:META domain-containing protein [Thiocystis violacea]|uniref:META domain-containing protein n=1 Tax=Thiocystis violacea TaxID=13725 RepID=UPI001907118C|nr:META domain-containing protein [Thiocystis violacea]MBK1724278.1 hypothetical protein [Thiocystis violacea]